jgi:porphobilinogen synthase
MYPVVRMRRNRKAVWIRDLLAEYNLSTKDLILPLFVMSGKNQMEEISSMPGIFRFSSDMIVKQAKIAQDLGIKAVALFPVIDIALKSNDAKEAYNLDNLICTTVSMIKNANLTIGVICDVALDPYTIHGHDGIIIDEKIDNDVTIEALANQALALAKAGSDSIAPSDMMDGRVVAIREYLDSENYNEISIISYAAKYASSLYGPFRDALHSGKLTGNDGKKTYQMDIRNSKEAMREIALDIEEGVDAIIIKPGLPFLDIIKEAHLNFDIPIFSYQVSGEYSMIKFASMNGCFNFQDTMIESLISLKRAGSSAIFCYDSINVAKFLNKQII